MSRPGGRWLFVAAALAITAVGGLARLWQVGALGLWGDEGLQGLAVRAILDEGVPHIASRLYLRGVPTLYAQAACAALLGLSELSLRLPSVLAGTATIAATYALGASLVSRRVGLVAALLVALSTWEIEFSRFARMYAIFQLCFTLSVWWLFEALVRGRRRFLAPAVLIAAITPLAHFLGLLVLVPAGLGLLWPDRARLSRPAILAVCATVGGIWAGYYGPLMSSLKRSLWVPPEGAESVAASVVPVAASRFFAPPLGLLQDLHASQPWLVYGALASALALALWLVAAVRRSGSSSVEALAVAALVPLAALHQFGLAAALLLVLAVAFPGSVALWLRSPRRIAALALAAALAGWLAYGLWLSSWSVAHHGLADSAFLTATNAFNYPRVYDKFLRFFAFGWPLVTALAAASGAFAVWRWIRRREGLALVYLALVAALSLLAFGMAESPYETPRYSFHLYPVLLTLAAVALDALGLGFARVAAGWGPLRRRSLAYALSVAVLGVGVNGDVDLAEAHGVVTRDYGDSIRTPWKSPGSSLVFRLDLRTPALFVKERLRPGDGILSLTPAVHRFYIGRIDYFVRENAKDAGIDSVEALEALVGRSAEERFWLLSNSIYLDDPWQFSDRFRCFVGLLAPRIVYTGLDGRSHVYLLRAADLEGIDRTRCPAPATGGNFASAVRSSGSSRLPTAPRGEAVRW